MDDLLHNENILIRYLDGELSANEKAELEQRLQTDAALREQLTNLQIAIEAVQQYGTAQRVQNIHPQMMAELKGQKAKVRTMDKTWRYALAIAASVLVVLIGAQLYFSSQLAEDKLYNEAFVDFSVSTSRGTAITPSQIEQLYQQKHYDTIVSGTQSARMHAKDSLLVGLSYLHTEKLQQASGYFSRVAGYENEYKQDAEYYLAMTYLKQKAYSTALPLLQKIAANPSHIYQKQLDEDFIKKVEKMANQ